MNDEELVLLLFKCLLLKAFKEFDLSVYLRKGDQAHFIEKNRAVRATLLEPARLKTNI